MHSSIINKIRILKPRKKSNLQNSDAKKFTIRNDNCHSSLTLLNKNEDEPPPLTPPVAVDNESETPAKGKWVPFYVLNVPNPTINKDSPQENPESSTSVNSSKENESQPSATNKYIASLCTHSKVNSTDTVTDSQASNISSSNVIYTTQNSMPIMTRSPSARITRARLLKINNSVNCFLCPTQFGTVQEMQHHYLENHKHKKRSNASSSKPVVKKVSKPSTKLQDPLKLTEGDSSIGDGEPKCPICSIYFKTKDEVRSHMTNVHCYKCSECHNTFYTLFQFTDHRCSKFIKQKKTKFKKKKIKTVTTEKEEEDPLAIPARKYVNIQPKAAVSAVAVTTTTFPTTSYPLIIKYPTNDQIIIPQQQLSKSFTSNIPYSPPIVSELEAVTQVKSDISSTSNSKKSDSSKKSLLECSVEELTSKEFNKMKLEEIIKNPNLSINWIPKQKHDSNKEFFSCGRCNVLCEDKEDYVEHLEECLRLSNVSILASSKPAQRILKLKSEIVPNKISKAAKTTINKMLLKELSNVIDAEDFEMLNVDEDPNEQENQNQPTQNNEKCIYPDIKGNISIKKIEPIKTPTIFVMKNRMSFPNQVKDHGTVTQSITHALSSITPTPTINTNQPMVIIPLSNSSESSQSISHSNNKPDSPDYPNISITDKSNSVTWNFIGSESGAVLKVESPHEPEISKGINRPRPNSNSSIFHLPYKSVKTFPKNKAAIASIAPPQLAYSNERNICDSKSESEPCSLSPLDDVGSTKSSISSDDCKDNCSSMEFLLDEDIKMEVEDEVVDDRF